MKSFEVENIRGQLIDVETKKRVILKRGGKFIISGKDDQFEERDEIHKESNQLNSEEKIYALEKEFKNCEFVKIADANTEFIYRIGLGEKTSEDKTAEYLFNAIVLEDLYVKTKNYVKWSLCPCLCKTTECIEGDVILHEPTCGSSLNNLFGNMVIEYFPEQRAAACNAFTTFYFKKGFPEPYMRNIKDRRVNSLDERRTAIARKYLKAIKNQ